MHNIKISLLASSLTLLLGSTVLATASHAQTVTVSNAQPNNVTIAPGTSPTASEGSIAPRKFTITTATNEQGQNTIANIAPTQAAPQAASNANVAISAPNNKGARNTTAIEAPQLKAAPVQAASAPVAAPSMTELPVASNETITPNYPGQTTNEQGFSIEPTQVPEAGPVDPALANANLTAQVQTVTVPLRSTIDAAVIEGFKSVQASLTLGMSKSGDLTIDDIAPALRSYETDGKGNITLNFSLPMVENILKKQGASSWMGLSNPILVWMVGLDGSSGGMDRMTIVSGQNLSAFAQAFMEAAPEYKYRLMFPIMDLEEINKISIGTVLDHQDETLTEATARYGSDFFIAAAISSVPNESGVTLKWNLYTKNGLAIGQSSISGVMEEVASLGAGDIARALMTYQSNLLEPDQQSTLTNTNVDIDMLGPGNGFVRMRITNVKSLQDLQAVRRSFVTYGFDGDIRILGFDKGQLVLELSTNSDPTNLEGTMNRSGDFSAISPWVFSFNKNEYMRPASTTNLGPATSARPNSKIILNAPVKGEGDNEAKR